jgi:epoxyqueuosine reductase
VFPIPDEPEDGSPEDGGPFACDGDTLHKAYIAPFARRNYYKAAVTWLKHSLALLCETYGGQKKDYRIYCNSHAVNEKAVAEAAGAGFRGKNTLVLSPLYGSRCILAVVGTTGDAVPAEFALETNNLTTKGTKNTKEREYPLCENCPGYCAEACPEKALDGKGRIERPRCVQWYASGNGETVPEALKNGWHALYGCTICQKACPYNRKPLPQGFWPELTKGAPLPGPLPEALDADKLLAASDEAFVSFFHGTTLGMKWLCPKALRKNTFLCTTS